LGHFLCCDAEQQLDFASESRQAFPSNGALSHLHRHKNQNFNQQLLLFLCHRHFNAVENYLTTD